MLLGIRLDLTDPHIVVDVLIDKVQLGFCILFACYSLHRNHDETGRAISRAFSA